MALKYLKSIIFVETDKPNHVGYDFPSDVGDIYDFPDHYSVIGQRLALMLTEAKIKLTDTPILAITFSSYLKDGVIESDVRHNSKELMYVNAGVDPVQFNPLSDDAKSGYLLDIAEKVLIMLSEEHEAKLKEIIMRLKQEGENIELVQQEKSDQYVNARLALQLLDSGQCRSQLVLQTPGGEPILKQELPSSHCFSVADQRYGNLLIRKNKIIIKPQKNIFSKNFEPIEIEYQI